MGGRGGGTSKLNPTSGGFDEEVLTNLSPRATYGKIDRACEGEFPMVERDLDKQNLSARSACLTEVVDHREEGAQATVYKKEAGCRPPRRVDVMATEKAPRRLRGPRRVNAMSNRKKESPAGKPSAGIPLKEPPEGRLSKPFKGK